MDCPSDINWQEWELVGIDDWYHYTPEHRDYLCSIMRNTAKATWSRYVLEKYVMLRKWEQWTRSQEPLQIPPPSEEGSSSEEHLFGSDDEEPAPDEEPLSEGNVSPSYSPTSPPESPTVPETPPSVEPRIQSRHRIVSESSDEEEEEHVLKKPRFLATEMHPVSAAVFAAFSNAVAEVETSLRDENKKQAKALADTKVKLSFYQHTNGILESSLSSHQHELERLHAKCSNMEHELLHKRHAVNMLVNGTGVLADQLRGKSSGEPAPSGDNGCPVCMTKFGDMIARNCGHTVCSECVPILVRTDNGHLCPQCRQPHGEFVLLRASGCKIE